ncbi:hypothetical protein [Actinacidiphila acidipaludis]|uniref:Uncharacterized protein n=1 Tax=Actinacidiphila acidipaludis TaxID=2873382 RepID=A0ABS7QB08_9ACTN|nr:hypothetical protein [Streptomyces acidipaludis]MBY8880313.1 hypothetical protein [Streptomyces acidipaludis]
MNDGHVPTGQALEADPATGKATAPVEETSSHNSAAPDNFHAEVAPANFHNDAVPAAESSGSAANGPQSVGD